MSGAEPRIARGLVPLLVIGAVVIAVATGAAQGLWLSNLHNGVLALALAFVGAYVLYQRPGHSEGVLFLVTAAVEAVLFLGRQVGQTPRAGGGRWWGWLGVWPLAVALTLTTFCVICFPDGRLPSPAWRWVAAVMVILAGTCASLSAIWPVDYAAVGVLTAHPFHAVAPGAASTVWSALAHPVYVGLQILWVVAGVVRWRASRGPARQQLTWLLAAAGGSVLALVGGLAVAGTPTPGLLVASLVPVAAGWAILHGQHVVAYSALSWLSRSDSPAGDLPNGLARAAAEALGAAGATVWMGAQDLRLVGGWPEIGEVRETTLASLTAAPGHQTRVVSSRGSAVGAVSINRTELLSLAEHRLFDDLAAQASLVVESIATAAERHEAPSLDGLTAREQDVLALLARGLSNAAISTELHLSIKTVEPVVSSIFTKLGLHADVSSNRRVLAALAYLPQRPT